VSALLPENVTLMWEDIEYQVKAGFVTLVTETGLFSDDGDSQPKTQLFVSYGPKTDTPTQTLGNGPSVGVVTNEFANIKASNSGHLFVTATDKGNEHFQ
jgi:hypothetical protein